MRPSGNKTPLALLALLLAGAATMPACSTVEGAGEDIETAGEYVEDTADDVEDAID